MHTYIRTIQVPCQVVFAHAQIKVCNISVNILIEK